MRYDILNFVKNIKYNDKEVTDSFMIDWANQKVAKSGKTSRIETFRDSNLKNSIFLIDLLYSLDKTSINYELVTPGETEEQQKLNAKYAINSAWKIGYSIFILWEDIVEVKPNMILLFIAAVMMCE